MYTEKKFLKRVELIPFHECWEWVGVKNYKGYGEIRSEKKMAHRLSWELYNGIIPNGLLVCHKCDNPSCVNPKHLFLGTHKDNAIDRNNKGRNASTSGENNGRHKLSNDQVKAIRSGYNLENNYFKLGKKYNVDPKHISRIIRNVQRNKG